jgi:Tfp pilus assembly protein PilN
MKPVNLLPVDLRPRGAGASGSGNAYWVLAVLGVLVVGVFAYVLTTNQVTDRKAQLAEVEQETAAAQQRGERLAAFGNFTAAKATRMASVTQLAQSRFDWERFVRELAHVLPDHAWLTEVDASATGAEGASATSDPAATADAASAAGSPTAALRGCAADQQDVATLLVRLRRLYRAQEVDLVDSSRSTDGGTDGCSGRYAFDLKVTFAPIAPAETAARVAASLGGGQ